MIPKSISICRTFVFKIISAHKSFSTRLGGFKGALQIMDLKQKEEQQQQLKNKTCTCPLRNASCFYKYFGQSLRSGVADFRAIGDIQRSILC